MVSGRRGAMGAPGAGVPQESSDALVEFVLRWRLGVGGEVTRPAIGQVLQRLAPGRRHAGWRGRLTEVEEGVAHGRGMGVECDCAHRANAIGAQDQDSAPWDKTRNAAWQN